MNKKKFHLLDKKIKKMLKKEMEEYCFILIEKANGLTSFGVVGFNNVEIVGILEMCKQKILEDDFPVNITEILKEKTKNTPNYIG